MQISVFSTFKISALEAKAAKMSMDSKTELRLRIQNKLIQPKIGYNRGSGLKAESLCKNPQFS